MIKTLQILKREKLSEWFKKSNNFVLSVLDKTKPFELINNESYKLFLNIINNINTIILLLGIEKEEMKLINLCSNY
ncbi:hypothetical protein HY636_03060, partial [Candidatus Woesearchaeota archaeon]|nr:hypothetical protein [Candidatus Woesearchaeota archaeon]